MVGSFSLMVNRLVESRLKSRYEDEDKVRALHDARSRGQVADLLSSWLGNVPVSNAKTT